MLQSWQSEKHELVPEHVETRPTDGVKPGPRPAESSLSIAQAAIEWINAGNWRKEDGTVHLPDGRHNKRVRDILKRIDPDTPLDSTVSMEATRACLEAARIFPGTAEYREAGYSKYTDHERCAALLGNISGSLTMKVCTGVKYGIPERTIQGDLHKIASGIGLSGKEVLKHLRNAYRMHEETKAAVDCLVRDMQFQKGGPQSYLNTTETCFMGATSNLLETIGDPDSRLSLGEKMREVVNAKGEEMLKCATSPGDQKVAKRLIDAKCTPAYVRKQSRLMEKLLDPTESSGGETSPFKKFSNLSHARARAANPLLDFAMRRKFQAHFKNLQQSGKLLHSQPEAHQVWSVDEIGQLKQTSSSAPRQSTLEPPRPKQCCRVILLARSGKNTQHRCFWVHCEHLLVTLGSKKTAKRPPRILSSRHSRSFWRTWTWRR